MNCRIAQEHQEQTRYTEPEVVPHSSELLPGISEQPLVRNLADWYSWWQTMADIYKEDFFSRIWRGLEKANSSKDEKLEIDLMFQVVNAADMDEGSRNKGFGGDAVALQH